MCPLDSVEESLLTQLGQVLWGWENCSACAPGTPCDPKSHPRQQPARLERYFQFYKALTFTYIDNCAPADKIFQQHGDLYQAITQLKSNPDITRADFHRGIATASGQKSPSRVGLLQASTLAVKVMTMIDCSPLHHSSDRLETGVFRLYWKDDVPFSKFLQDLFPTESHPILSFVDSDVFLDVRSELRAVKLRKHLGITFRPTHDIRNHLRLDRRQNVLEIYHHTAFIKEQLRLTKGTGDFSVPSKSIKV